MVLILLRHALPSRILLKALIDGHILLKEGEPIVTLRERTGNDSLLTPASHLSVTRIMFLIPRLVVHASEFLAGLYSVRFFGQEQPTLQVIEAEALESQLASALTTNLIHELILVTQELGVHMFCTYPVTQGIDGTLRGQGWISRAGTICTIHGSASLCIHQIDIT